MINWEEFCAKGRCQNVRYLGTASSENGMKDTGLIANTVSGSFLRVPSDWELRIRMGSGECGRIGRPSPTCRFPGSHPADRQGTGCGSLSKFLPVRLSLYLRAALPRAQSGVALRPPWSRAGAVWHVYQPQVWVWEISFPWLSSLPVVAQRIQDD